MPIPKDDCCQTIILASVTYLCLALLLSSFDPTMALGIDNALEDLLNSKTLHDMPRSTERDSPKELKKYVDPNSNYGQLVLENGKYSLLNVWLGPVPTGFKLDKSSIKRTHEFMELSQKYHNKEGSEYYLKIYVPYPKFIDAAGMDLIRQFSELSPPLLKVDSREEIKVNDIPGHLYHRLDGSSSILIELPKNALLNILCLHPKSVANMISFAQSLNIWELKSRLAS
ncbi:MAG: hypothetical protein GYA55_06015 [SAR324 cluster bacterium]|uniref:Uncharacterized protein n=1 Tax=SAR324 cluster bacterium TaxID=2024889 RepID=A0A7X9IJJ7_9DELT|nr:hypothetical protein [SAR324 cluster bacterium]